VQVTTVLTRMDEPLGMKTGHWLEVEECEDYLSGDSRPTDLHSVVLALAAAMVALASRGKLSLPQARAACEQALGTRAPLQEFYGMFQAQGGDWEQGARQRESLRRDLACTVWEAPETGFLIRNAALAFGDLLGKLGGGRATQDQGIDPLVGVVWAKKVGDPVRKGERVVQVYHRNPSQSSWIQKDLQQALATSSQAPLNEAVIVEE